jgi:hypothetical protein
MRTVTPILKREGPAMDVSSGIIIQYSTYSYLTQFHSQHNTVLL